MDQRIEFALRALRTDIRSDNGASFAHTQVLFGLSRLSVWWVALEIDLERGRPGHPQDNGGHERIRRDIACPGMYGRRVNKHGLVKWEGAEIFVSGSLRGWSVGLKLLADGKVEVWFGRLKLGWLDWPTESFQGAASRPLEAGQPESQCVI